MMHDSLKRFFDEKGITQQQVADALGVSLQYVNQLLNGRKTLGKKNAERLANIYGLSKPFLLTGEGSLIPDIHHQQIEKIVVPPSDDSTANLVELYAQRIRLVDDLRQSLKEELAEVRAIKEDMQTAVNDFRDATYRLTQALKSLNEQRPPSIGIAADDGDY